MKSIVNVENKKVITSMEVAKMMEIEHHKILRKLEGSKGGRVIGIIPTLTQSKIGVSDYFIKSSYKDSTGKENKCYLMLINYISDLGMCGIVE